MLFQYESITQDGRRVSGKQQAKDKQDLAHQLKSRGEMLVSVRRKDEEKFSVNSINVLLSRVSTKEKIVFARNLSAMIKAGLPLVRSLSILSRQTKNPKFKDTIKKLEMSVRRGETLSDALNNFSKVFPPLFVSMVRAGERSGNLSESLAAISQQMERSYTLRKKVQGALIYPAIIVTAMIIVGVIMLIFVVPTLTETFKGLDAELPASTQAVIFISDLIGNNIVLFLALLVFLVGGSFLFARTYRGKRVFHRLFIITPLVGPLVKKVNSARTARTMSTLLSSGVDVVASLNITKDILQNVYYKDVLERAESEVPKGVNLSSVFSENEDIFPILVGEMVEVGEETGKLSDMFLEVAIFFETEVERVTKNLTTVIEPILMIVVGVVVGFFAVAMISPTYSLLNSI